jgi:tetratricopeptide (TPR) repeat protein
MPFRIYFGTAGLLLGLVLLAGCASSSGGKLSPMARSSTTSRRATKEQPDVDYSAKAIEARTESHARYASGILHDLNDEPEAAAEDFFKAAMADLSNEPLVLEASTRLIRAKKNDKAIDLLSKAAARADAGGAILARLGLAYSVAGKKDLAIDADRRAIRKSPASLSGYQYLAQLYLQNNETEEGLKILDEALKQPNTDANFLIDLAETYTLFARAGKLDAIKPRALDALKRAAVQKPNTPVLLQRLGDAFNFLGEHEKAAEWYAKLLERFPHFPDARNKLADLYLRRQDFTNALPQVQALVRESPTNPQLNYQLGALYFMEKKMPQAAEYFGKAVLFAPHIERPYYDLAAAQINLNQPKEALATLDKARERFQPSFTGEYYAGQAFQRMKDYTNALKRYTAAEIMAKATATNELTPGFYFQIGAASERTQKFKEAEDYFRKCLEMAPDFAEALNYLGYMWAERGENLQEARAMIEKALKFEPKNGAFLDSLGWVLFKLDMPREALDYLLKAVEQTEEPDATLYDHLGDIYGALQKPDKAREAWQKALSIEPSEQIQKKLGPPPDKSGLPGGSGPR